MPPAVACGGARRSRGQNKTKSARAVTRAQQSSHQHAARVVVAPPTPTCRPRPPSNAAAVVRLRARAQRRAQTTTVAADRRTPPPSATACVRYGEMGGIPQRRGQAGGWAARRGGGWRRPDTRAPGRGTARVQRGCGGTRPSARARSAGRCGLAGFARRRTRRPTLRAEAHNKRARGSHPPPPEGVLGGGCRRPAALSRSGARLTPARVAAVLAKGADKGGERGGESERAVTPFAGALRGVAFRRTTEQGVG